MFERERPFVHLLEQIAPDKRTSRRHISRDSDKDLSPQRALQYNANLIKWNFVVVVVVAAAIVAVFLVVVIVSLVPGCGKLIGSFRETRRDTIGKNRMKSITGILGLDVFPIIDTGRRGVKETSSTWIYI